MRYGGRRSDNGAPQKATVVALLILALLALSIPLAANASAAAGVLAGPFAQVVSRR